jgi:hypothetical protein
MANTQNNVSFLNNLVEEISKKDKLHSKKILCNVEYIQGNFPSTIRSN